MRHLIAALFAILLVSGVAQAQTQYPDLIVTAKGDTIRCAFITVSETDIKYYYKDYDGDLAYPAKGKKQKINLKYYQNDYFAKREAGPGKPLTVAPMSFYQNEAKVVKAENAEEDDVVLRLEVGIAQRLAKAEESYYSGYKEYVNGLRTGPLLGLYIGSFRSKYVGGGFRAEYSSAKSTWDSQKTKTSVRLISLGGEVEFRLPFKEKGGSHLYATFGPGLSFYSEHVTAPKQDYTLEYKGITLRAGVGAHLRVADGFAFTLGTHALFGNAYAHQLFSGVNVSLARVAATGGMAFTF